MKELAAEQPKHIEKKEC